jgi:hypothetical protein
MTRRVQQHHVPIWCRLHFSPHCTKTDGLDDGLAEIVDGKIQVHLLGSIPVGPGWRVVVSDPHGGKPESICFHRNEIFA